MCRVFGSVSAEPVSIQHELLEAENPLIRQSEEHDSGWGMAVYERADGADPQLRALPEAAYQDGDSWRHRDARAHLQRPRAARHDGRPDAREHASVRLGNYSFCHNGTILATRACSSPA